MMTKLALYTAGVIFAVVSALHLVRYFLGSEVSIAGSTFPV